MKAYDIVRLPSIRKKMLKNYPGRKGLRKMIDELRKRYKALEVYRAFKAYDTVAIDLYLRKNRERNR
jgi:hypothetical protein